MKAPTYDEAIGDALYRIRKAAKLTQVEMCNRLRRRHLSIYQPMLSRYERGAVSVPNSLVQLVERELGLPPGSVYRAAFGDDEPIRYKRFPTPAPLGATQQPAVTAVTMAA